MSTAHAPGRGCRRRGDARGALLLFFTLLAPFASPAAAEETPRSPEDWLPRALAALARPELTAGLAAEAAIVPTREGEALAVAGARVQEDEREALARFETISAAALDPLIARLADLTLGELLLRAGEPRRAAAALAAAPRDPRPEAVWRRQMLEASARAAAGDRAEARRLLAAAGEGARAELASLRGNARASVLEARRLALRWSGWLAAQEGDQTGARALWRTALAETSPPAATADTLRLAVAASWFAEGVWDSAAVWAAPPGPGREAAREPSGQRRGPAWDYLLGWAAFARGEYATADSAFSRLPVAGPEVPAAWVDQISLARGWIASRRGDPESALRHYARVRAGESGGAADLRRYGEAVAQLQAGALEEAVALLDSPPPGFQRESEGPRTASPDAGGAQSLLDDEGAARLAGLWLLARAYARAQLGWDEQALADLDGFHGRGEGDPLGSAAAVLRGDLHFRRGEMEAAYALYTGVATGLDDPPEDLRRRQALAALGAGRWGAAARGLADLQLKFPATARAAEYAFWRGEALYQLGRLGEARALFERAERLGADAMRCAYALGWCAADEGRAALALELFDRALRACARCELADDLRLGRAYGLARLGRLDDADAEILRLCKRWDEPLDSLLLQEPEAEPDAGAGDEGPARLGDEPAARPAIAPGPARRAAAERFVEVARAEPASALGAHALYWAGAILQRAGQACEAVQTLRRGADHPGASDALRARILVARAGAARLCGGVGASVADYREALAGGVLGAQERRTVYVALIGDLARAGDWSGAQEALAAMEGEGLRGGAELSEARLQLAAALASAGRGPEAQRCYEDWLAENAGSPRADEIRLRRAELIEAGGDWESALREYAILADTALPAMQSQALERAGMLHLLRREDRPALDAFRRRLALALSPAEAAETRARIAAAHERQGERAAASNEWEKIAHAGPQVPDSLRALGSFQLGRIALESGDARSALREFEAADSLGYGPEASRWVAEARRRAQAQSEADENREGAAPGGAR